MSDPPPEPNLRQTEPTSPTAEAGGVILEARGLWKVFQDASRRIEVLKGIDLSLEPGKIVAIIGPSGVGKSTLLNILGLLDRPTEGQVLYRNRDLASLGDRERSRLRSRDFGFVFQMYHLLPDLDAQENAMLPALMGPGLFGRTMGRRQALQRSAELLERLGLGHRLDHRPAKLSGGEKQRVAIARALMNEPKVVFLDEPTGNLDPKTGREIFELLLDYNRSFNQTFVLITHERELAAEADLVLRMQDGRLVEVGHSSMERSAPIEEKGQDGA